MGDWVGRDHSPDHTFPLLQKVYDAVKADGPVGIIGYCYGEYLEYEEALRFFGFLLQVLFSSSDVKRY